MPPTLRHPPMLTSAVQASVAALCPAQARWDAESLVPELCPRTQPEAEPPHCWEAQLEAESVQPLQGERAGLRQSGVAACRLIELGRALARVKSAQKLSRSRQSCRHECVTVVQIYPLWM